MKISGAEKLILTILCDISESQTKKGKGTVMKQSKT